VGTQEASVEITVSKNENALVVSVDGRIDTLTAAVFQSKMEEVLNQGEKRVILDFEKVEYVSSAGLRSILFAAKKAWTSGGKVCCCSLQRMVRTVFDVSGFTAMIPVFDSLEEALKH